MERKFKFSDQPRRVKIIYAAVIGVLCVTAVVIGIVSAASKQNTLPDDPVVNAPSDNENPNETPPDSTDPDDGEDDKKPEKFSMISPISGEVTKEHSIDTPVFSNTLNEWRVHTGIDIAAEEGAEVCCAAEGVVTKVYTDPLFGKSVEVSHENGITSIYSNLSATGIAVEEGDAVAKGAVIGVVGDTSLSELADEPHLHFAVKVNGVSVNPLDYLENSADSTGTKV